VSVESKKDQVSAESKKGQEQGGKQQCGKV